MRWSAGCRCRAGSPSRLLLPFGANLQRGCNRIASALLALGTPLLAPCIAHADTLIDNVDGFTLDSAGRVERLSGIVVGNDGRIVQILHPGDRRTRTDYLVDGKGRVLMPGLIDSHVELMPLGFAALTLDLTPAKSLAEAQARIAAYAAAHPDRAWILGRGWDASAWGLDHGPGAADLDAAVADRPVWLISANGHAGWANSAALAAAGITAATKDPTGGRIERIMPGGKPSGILLEAAQALIGKAVPPPRPEDRDLALVVAQDLLVRRGITTVADMGTTIEDWQAYRRAGDQGGLRIRIMAYAAGTEAMSLIGGPGPSPWLYDDRLRLNGVALTLDGSLTVRGAWLKAGYADRPGAGGLPRLGETQLRNLLSRAAIDRFQVALEANGDAAVAAALDALGELAPTYKGERRWRIEGAGVIAAADVARLAPLGAIASLRPAGLAPALAEARLGTDRADDAFRWNSLAAAGVTLAFGSGAPQAVPDPWAGWSSATTRQDGAGLPFGGWHASERLTREAALAGYTIGAAFAGFAEGRFGRIAVGQRADFLLVDRDPLLAGASELRAIRLLETWIGGRKVWAAATAP